MLVVESLPKHQKVVVLSGLYSSSGSSLKPRPVTAEENHQEE